MLHSTSTDEGIPAYLRYCQPSTSQMEEDEAGSRSASSQSDRQTMLLQFSCRRASFSPCEGVSSFLALAGPPFSLYDSASPYISSIVSSLRVCRFQMFSGALPAGRSRTLSQASQELPSPLAPMELGSVKRGRRDIDHRSFSWSSKPLSDPDCYGIK